MHQLRKHPSVLELVGEISRQLRRLGMLPRSLDALDGLRTVRKPRQQRSLHAHLNLIKEVFCLCPLQVERLPGREIWRRLR